MTVLWTLLACVSSPTPDDAGGTLRVAPAHAPNAPPGQVTELAYVLRIPARHTHRVEVELTLPAPDAPFELWMPTWTPGSYKIREYARQVETVQIVGDPGHAPTVTKVRKNRWRVDPAGSATLQVQYTLYAREMGVQSNFVDAEFAVLNGAPTFLVVDGLAGPYSVTVEPPPGWTVHTALPTHPDEAAHHFLAPDLDTLVDAPMVLGTPDVRTFEVQGVRHHLITLGEPGPWDQDKAAAALERVVAEQLRFWGDVPYGEDRFLNVLSESRGGLEHRDSTLMMARRGATSTPDAFESWLGLASHEFFHTWNVKRLRPVGLGPFDYEHEVHTRSLWVAEGITSYYDDLLLARAGLLDDDDYLERLGGNIERLHTTPGRAVTPLGQTSFDAWIVGYLSDENTSNRSISYYTKGAVVGWLLDAELRRHSGGRASLDTLMRRAYRELTEGYEPAQFRALATDEAGIDMTGFFATAVDSTDELDYDAALAWWGLRFEPTDADGEAEDDTPEPGWHGAQTQNRSGRQVVSRVPRDTPAWASGINVDDELIAFDGLRIDPSDPAATWRVASTGTTGTLTVARRGVLRDLELTLATKPAKAHTLQPNPNASTGAVARRQAWLAATPSATASR